VKNRDDFRETLFNNCRAGGIYYVTGVEWIKMLHSIIDLRAMVKISHSVSSLSDPSLSNFRYGKGGAGRSAVDDI
jgi:hypothetical protein